MLSECPHTGCDNIRLLKIRSVSAGRRDILLPFHTGDDIYDIIMNTFVSAVLALLLFVSLLVTRCTCPRPQGHLDTQTLHSLDFALSGGEDIFFNSNCDNVNLWFVSTGAFFKDTRAGDAF